MILNTTEDKKIIPIDGGILYNGEWQMINMTNIIVEQLDEEDADPSDAGWIIGKLKSGERFWFTWNLTINYDVVTGVWIYDEITLTEITDHDAYMTRLFY